MNNGKSSTLSYNELRIIVGILAFALPVILIIGGYFLGGDFFRHSISSYYYSKVGSVFVGVLFITGAFLFTYRPEKCYEDGNFDSTLGDFACFFAIGIAVFPTKPEDAKCCNPDIHQCPEISNVAEITSNLHFISAALFFISLIIFAGFLFTKSDKTWEENKDKPKGTRNRIYIGSAVTMVACIILIGIYSWFLECKSELLDSLRPVLVLETLALWAFGVSWFIKGETLFKD